MPSAQSRFFFLGRFYKLKKKFLAKTRSRKMFIIICFLCAFVSSWRKKLNFWNRPLIERLSQGDPFGTSVASLPRNDDDVFRDAHKQFRRKRSTNSQQHVAAVPEGIETVSKVRDCHCEAFFAEVPTECLRHNLAFFL